MTALKENEVKRAALKFHLQLGHPTCLRLVKLIEDAGITDLQLERAIKKVTEGCVICIKFKKAKSRPIVSFSMVSKFNEAIVMDVKVWENKYF